jgi:hypothetical protein
MITVSFDPPLLRRLLALTAFACAGHAALGQTADPTRPSAAWRAAQARAAGSEPAADAGAEISIERPKGAFVVIDGTVVRPGQMHNGAKLLGVGKNGAVWQRGGASEETEGNGTVVKTAVGGDGSRALRRKTQTNGESR